MIELLMVFFWTLSTIFVSLFIPFLVLFLTYEMNELSRFKLSWYSQGRSHPLFRQIIRYSFLFPLIGAIIWLWVPIASHPYVFLGMGVGFLILVGWLTETIFRDAEQHTS